MARPRERMTDGMETASPPGTAEGMAPVAEFPEPVETIKMPWGETIKLPGEAMPLESADPEWVDTPSARQVLRVLEYARKYGDIAVVHEGTGVDKTESARHYKGLCKNVWIAVMLPAEERLLPCGRQVARAHGTEYWGRDTAYLYHGLSRALGGKRGLLIIDEAQHLGIPRWRHCEDSTTKPDAPWRCWGTMTSGAASGVRNSPSS